jgi:hypothetical protein
LCLPRRHDSFEYTVDAEALVSEQVKQYLILIIKIVMQMFFCFYIGRGLHPGGEDAVEGACRDSAAVFNYVVIIVIAGRVVEPSGFCVFNAHVVSIETDFLGLARCSKITFDFAY